MKKHTENLLSLAQILSLAVTLVAVSMAAGCSPRLSAVTSPPPTKTARMEGRYPPFSHNKFFAHVSRGVAMGFTCESGTPCNDVRVTIDDPSIVKVVPAHLARLQSQYPRYDKLPPSTFLLIGLEPGRTMVRLHTNHGPTTIRVDVSE